MTRKKTESGLITAIELNIGTLQQKKIITQADRKRIEATRKMIASLEDQSIKERFT